MYAPQDPTRTWLRWLVAAMLIWALVCWVTRGHAQPRPRNPATTAATLGWLTARLDYRESTGNNRGPQIDPMVRAGGGTPGAEWCGFTQAACQRAFKLPIPKNGLQGGARYWFTDPARTYYQVGARGSLDLIQPGDLAGFAWRPSVVIHHITRFAEVVPPLRKGRPPRGFYTLGGNEGRGPTAGLQRTFYPATSITAAARWDY